MIDLALQILVAMECIAIAGLAEPAINRMSPCTTFTPRAAFHLLAVGAVARIFSLLSGDVPSIPTAILTGGVALLLICDRWRIGHAGERRAEPFPTPACQPRIRRNDP